MMVVGSVAIGVLCLMLGYGLGNQAAITEAIAVSISSLMDRYCAWRSTNCMLIFDRVLEM